MTVPARLPAMLPAMLALGLAAPAHAGIDRAHCEFTRVCVMPAGQPGRCAPEPAPLSAEIAFVPEALGDSAFVLVRVAGREDALAAVQSFGEMRLLTGALDEGGATTAFMLSLHAEGPAWLSLHRPDGADHHEGRCDAVEERR